MSVENAKEFLKHLETDKDLQKMLAGFTMDEVKQAIQEMQDKGELSQESLEHVAGGTIENGYPYKPY